jgi:hypothetical protein
MVLTSTALQVATIGAAVAATLAALLLWNRVRGPRPVRALARFGLLTGGYAATAVAVLISVNIAYGGLIVSMSDLFSDVNTIPGPHLRHPLPQPSGVGRFGEYDGYRKDGLNLGPGLSATLAPAPQPRTGR